MSDFSNKRNEVLAQLQAAVSYLGCECFITLVSEALGQQAEATSDLEDKNTSARYEIRKMQLDALINEKVTYETLRKYREEERAEEVRTEQNRIVAGLDTVRPGQVWRENDRRTQRQVEIIAVDKDDETATIKNAETGKFTVASLSRFNGKARGYSLVGGI